MSQTIAPATPRAPSLIPASIPREVAASAVYRGVTIAGRVEGVYRYFADSVTRRLISVKR